MKDVNKTERIQYGQNGDDTRRREGAIRIFGALSGVDEEYLAACETVNKGKVIPFSGFGGFARRYGRVFAAALCFVVLGIGYLALLTAPRGKNMSNTTAFRADNAARSQEQAVAGADTGGAEDGMNGRAAAEAMDEMRQEAVVTNDGEDALAELQDEMSKEMSASLVNKEMTMEQAANLEVVGAYLPDVWPARGEIIRLVGDDEAGAERVSLTWSYANQWDTFFLTVENLGEELPSYIKESIADKDRPEYYDENMYEIPYAETVPKEYWVVFQDPVYEEDTFDKDCVRARLISHPEDSGDTDTPRGMFRILYRDGENYVLVRFNGRGTVDEIWDMMSSIGR